MNLSLLDQVASLMTAAARILSELEQSVPSVSDRLQTSTNKDKRN